MMYYAISRYAVKTSKRVSQGAGGLFVARISRRAKSGLKMWRERFGFTLAEN